jgi:hypothetical protein
MGIIEIQNRTSSNLNALTVARVAGTLIVLHFDFKDHQTALLRPPGGYSVNMMTDLSEACSFFSGATSRRFEAEATASRNIGSGPMPAPQISTAVKTSDPSTLLPDCLNVSHRGARGVA